MTERMTRVLSSAPLPNLPDPTSAEAVLKWRKDILEYLRRLQGFFTASNLTSTLTGESFFLAELESASETTSGSNKYKYKWREVEKNGDSFSVKTGGLKGTYEGSPPAGYTETYALNLVEFPNGVGVNQLGNGVDTDNFLGTFAMVDASTGGPVVLMFRVTDQDGSKGYVFQFENAIDGACS